MSRPTDDADRLCCRHARAQGDVLTDAGHGEDVPTGRSRRSVLVGVGALAVGGLAGCLGDEGPAETAPAEPIALTDGETCDVCGMVIEDHHGPAGQLFFEDGEPEDRDGPARFDSLVELRNYLEERTQRGWELREAFVTDYSSVQYDLVERNGTTYVSSHVDAAAFADATTLSYVVDSAVEGAMGPDYVPFSEAADAEEFVDENGGEIRQWDDLP
ncbi:nitrous oxide reductase accessory protein NosL [Natrarchaeobius chitinivorans]|uniref:Nitrous oxide reductase accessory protein NosL n=1 Tax=Natrarchaeobius chitinivorans TaxID=1679083 RepID=A0A3N6LT70_NATCH|nr:nitrous oxide reductase accessory protein NosL [Natrarchaeobius chitinivorans]RQG91817.1 nitrous oxide reductase accessory protein NosL [Natrarchaeobius chitinivorans]